MAGGRNEERAQNTFRQTNDLDGEDVADMLANGAFCLDRHQLNEAQTWFNRALVSIGIQIQGQEKLYVQALSALAEVHCKRSRSCRHDDLEWYNQMMQSVALHYEAFCCCKELEEKSGTMEEKERRKWYWIENFQKKSSQQLGIMDKILFESLQDRLLLKHEKDSMENLIGDSSSWLDIEWLKKVECHIEQQVMHSKVLKSDIPFKNEEIFVDTCESNDESGKDDSKSTNPPRVDCRRVQKAIMKLVRQISSDMRQRYIRKKLTEEMFRSTVSSEMIAQFAPMPETRDVLTLFENAIIQYKYGMNPDEFREWELDTSDVESDGTTRQTMSTDLNSDDLNDIQSPSDDLCDAWEEKLKGNIPSEDTYKLSGVLTVWKAYHNQPRFQARKFKPYILQGFEELSPLTEVQLTSSDQYFSQDTSNGSIHGSYDDSSETSSLSSVAITDVNLWYLSKHRIKHALALTLIKYASELQKSTSLLPHAAVIYKYALGILKSGSSLMKNRKTLIAQIFENIGKIRCSQGNLSIGSQLMQEAMELYSENDNVENINTAKVWYELGNAYMKDHWQNDSISEHIMKLVKDELDRDLHSDKDSDGPPDDASVSSDSSEEGEDYHVCAHEAMGCYKSALSILSKLRKRKEVHTDLYVDVLTRLGDCSIVVGQYERAVLCFEEALYLCQNTFGSVSLTNSAHILFMLGTTNFLLGIYSKAATMYQTAHILQQHLYGLEDNFEMAFTLTMQGITYFEMKSFHKCIAMCIKASALYSNIYKENITNVEPLNRWFITQTLYLLGYVYGTFNFSDKALHNLELANDMMEKSNDEGKDIHQQVKILKAMADVYANLDMNSTAIDYYQQALDKSLLLGDEQSITTLHNQLLNRMAGVHVCKKEYEVAAEYLEQALDCQRNVETSIQGDLIGILQQLGMTYTLSGDLDRAIECYNECQDAYQEASVASGPDIAKTLTCLGTLYHVKGCMQDDNEEMMEYIQSSDQYYQQAVDMDSDSYICVHYANFLHQQEQYAEALLAMLPFVFPFSMPGQPDLQYNGPEQAVLPEHLLYDLNDLDEVCLDSAVFARFLGILCLKQLDMIRDAEDCLVGMVCIVHGSNIALNHIMLGYSLLEMKMYLEAAESFGTASILQPDENSFVNKWISLCLWSYITLQKAVTNLWIDASGLYMNLDVIPFTILVPCVPSYAPQTLKDSGYYDHSDVQICRNLTSELSEQIEITALDDTYDEWDTEEEVVENPSFLLESIFGGRQMQHLGLDVDCHTKVEAPNDGDDEWIVEEEVTLETPSAILAALTNARRTDLDFLQNRYEDSSYFTEESAAIERQLSTDRDGNIFDFDTKLSTMDGFSDVLQNNILQDDLNANQALSRNGSGPKPLFLDGLNRSHIDGMNGNSVLDVSIDQELADEDNWDSWVVTEEVVDTPPEILQAIAANNNR